MSIIEKIDRGLEIIGEMAALKKELESIEDAIRDHARAHASEHRPLGDEAREGRQYIARGSTLQVPVVFTADKIMGSFAWDSAKHHAVKEAATIDCEGEPKCCFDLFFKEVHTAENRFDDGKKFRDHAEQILGDSAPGFITACLMRDKHGLPKSDVKIEWKQAAAEAKLAEVAA